MEERPVAIITGATGGIGSAVARRLSREGYHVGLTARGWDALCSLKQELVAMHAEESMISAPHALWSSGDVNDPHHLEWLVKDVIAHWRKLDLLVTCHGAVPCIKPSEDVTEQDWRTIWATDVEGTFRICQAVGRQMLQQRSGCIINLASIHAFSSYPQRAAYAGAKAAVVGFSRVLAIEWANRGVRVNCIAPAQVSGQRTDEIARVCDAEEWKSGEFRSSPHIGTIERMRQRVPNRQFVQPEDVAGTVVWIARTPSVNGQTIILDGGLLASAWYEPFLERA